MHSIELQVALLPVGQKATAQRFQK